jgi:hypothetical protein
MMVVVEDSTTGAVFRGAVASMGARAAVTLVEGQVLEAGVLHL